MAPRRLIRLRAEWPCFVSLLATFSLLAAIVTACETVPREAAETTQTARAQAFMESLDTYLPASPEEQAVITLLKEYRDAYNASDLSRIEGLLTSNFELRYYEPQSEKKYVVMLQDRSMYLKKRSAWSSNRPRQETLIVNVLSMLVHPEGKGALVVAATTYKSKHFNPRYVETFGFKRTPGGWRLRRTLVMPVQPKEPKVDIYFAELVPPNVSLKSVGFMSDLGSLGPGVAFQRYVRGLSKTAPSVARKEHVPTLVIFREPPPAGAIIEIAETQIGRGGNRFNSAAIVPPSTNPYFLLSGIGWWGSGYSVNIKVTMNGTLIADQTLRLPR